MNRLLLITYEFPPKGGPGIQRPLQTARLLDSMGWDVTVLTVKDPPASALDPDTLAALPPTVRIARAWSLEPTRALQAMRRLLGRAGGGRGSSAGAGYSGAPGGFIRFVQAFFFPDEKVGWTPFAVREVLRRHRERPFDVILASGPPFTAYRVAWKASRKLGVPWVADVRDPIVGNYFFRPHTPLHAWYKRRFERRVLSSASRTIVGTSAYAERDMVSRNPGLAERITTITNGFDPAEFDADPPHRDREHFTLSYVGGFQGAIAPDTFLDAVASACTDRPALRDELRVRFVGMSGGSVERAVAQRGLDDVVRLVGFVPHADAVREMRASDALLLVLADLEHLRPTLTGKLPEYLGARKPVLALVPEGAARDVLERSGAAWIVGPDDARGTADALIEMHQAWRAGSLPGPDPAAVAEFDRTKLVARLSELLADVVR